MDRQPEQDVRTSYDAVADEYVRRIADELRHKPFDRRLLDRFATSVRAAGPVCDLGCGPGHVARYLRDCGVEVCGLDASPRMIEHARRLFPDIEFQVGDMRALPEKGWAGLVAFYSIIHFPPGELPAVLDGFRRALRPAGRLLVAFHLGDETMHLEEWWGRRVSVDFHFFRSNEVTQALVAAGFELEEVVERDPYPEVEHPSRRA